MSPGPWPDTSKLHYQRAVFSVGNTGRCSEEASVLGHAFLSFLYRAERGQELPTLCQLAGWLPCQFQLPSGTLLQSYCELNVL